MEFKLQSQYNPTGDQPQAIEELTNGIIKGVPFQTLLGVTGSGKTFTMANVIANSQRPTLILSHNKTLAAQLYAEFKCFFPENSVHYFVSYYDYYQPEAYVPSTDTYIEKDSSINDEIDELRHAATSALLSRDDVIVVASVSCIYGIGEVEEYKNKMLTLSVGDKIERNKVLVKLVEMLYERNDLDFKRGTFRAKGDTIEVIPANERKSGIMIELFGDEIDRISEFDTLTGKILKDKKSVSIFPASHFVTGSEKMEEAIRRIEAELQDRLKVLETFGYDKKSNPSRLNWSIITDECCKIAFLKGAFLTCGTINDPNKGYHLEFVVPYLNLSKDLKLFIDDYDELSVTTKVITRSSNYVIYFKDSEAIEDILTVMGAMNSCLELMGVKMYKDMRHMIEQAMEHDNDFIVEMDDEKMARHMAAAKRAILEGEDKARALHEEKVAEPAKPDNVPIVEMVENKVETTQHAVEEPTVAVPQKIPFWKKLFGKVH